MNPELIFGNMLTSTNYDENDWLNAYMRQINYFNEYLLNNSIKKQKLSSIFFGGGTPSLMDPIIIEKIILVAAVFITSHIKSDKKARLASNLFYFWLFLSIFEI